MSKLSYCRRVHKIIVFVTIIRVSYRIFPFFFGGGGGGNGSAIMWLLGYGEGEGVGGGYAPSHVECERNLEDSLLANSP